VTSSWGGSRYLPMAFTEQGVAMFTPLNAEPIYLGLPFNNNGQLTIYPMKFMIMTAKRISSGQATDREAKKIGYIKEKQKPYGRKTVKQKGDK
jgi:hypothetical protein